jgi:O-antigen/teichoic acid export membrane protein
MVAIGLPALISIMGISLLTRYTDENTAGVIMWTWFLMGSAAALNAGLHPSLTNELGQAPAMSQGWNGLVEKYISASNVIYLLITILVVFRALGSTEGGGVGVALLQSVLLWQSGISSLLMTALNYSGHTDLTAKSRIVVNSLVFSLPVLTSAFSNSLELSLSILVFVKFFQSRALVAHTIRLMDQIIVLDIGKFFGFSVLIFIIKRQWRMMFISLSQMSFSFIDRFAVVSFFGVAAYKSYGAILDVLSLVWLIASVFIIQLHPVFANSMGSISAKRSMVVHYTCWLIVIGGGGILFIYWNTHLFLNLILNMNATAELDTIFRNIVIGLLCSLTYILINTLFISTGKQTRVLSISTVSLIAYSFFLIPVITEFGLVGLSYMFLFKFAFEAICFHYYFLSDYFRRNLNV